MVCIDCFPGSSAGKESTYNAGDLGSIFGSRISTGEGIGYCLQYSWASLVTQMVKTLPAMQETWFWSLDWEDPLEKGTATHSSILAWRIPWTKEPGTLQSMGLQRVRHDWVTFSFIYGYCLSLLSKSKIHVTLRMEPHLLSFLLTPGFFNPQSLLCLVKFLM